jgi:hypothetical protein
MTSEAAKDVKCIEVGNWYSEYECRRCGEKWVQNDDAPTHVHKCATVLSKGTESTATTKCGEYGMKPPYRCASCGHEWTEDTIWCPKCNPAKSGAGSSPTPPLMAQYTTEQILYRFQLGGGAVEAHIRRLEHQLAEREARVVAADKLWKLCVDEGFPWGCGDVQDKLTALGFLVATDMTTADEAERCANCNGDCDTCYRAIESVAALAPLDGKGRA